MTCGTPCAMPWATTHWRSTTGSPRPRRTSRRRARRWPRRHGAAEPGYSWRIRRGHHWPCSTPTRGLDRHAELVSAVAAVSRLALENTRLQAGLRAQLLEVEQARASLMRSGFAQRRQLERDLHDGAQQRLLAVGMKLAALEADASSRSGPPRRGPGRQGRAARGDERAAPAGPRDLPGRADAGRPARRS